MRQRRRSRFLHAREVKVPMGAERESWGVTLKEELIPLKESSFLGITFWRSFLQHKCTSLALYMFGAPHPFSAFFASPPPSSALASRGKEGLVRPRPSLERLPNEL